MPLRLEKRFYSFKMRCCAIGERQGCGNCGVGFLTQSDERYGSFGGQVVLRREKSLLAIGRIVEVRRQLFNCAAIDGPEYAKCHCCRKVSIMKFCAEKWLKRTCNHSKTVCDLQNASKRQPERAICDAELILCFASKD